MKLQFVILVFIVCLNLATGVALALGLPGTEYVYSADPGGYQQNATYYEEHFNSTEVAERWGANTNLGIPIVGDIFSGLYFLAINWQYLIDGFPIFLDWVSDSFITDASAKAAFDIIANALRAIFAILMAIWFIEFIAGRYVTQ